MKKWWIVMALIVLSVTAACGIAGGTSVVNVNINNLGGIVGNRRPIVVSSVEKGSESSKVEAVMVFNWGNMSDGDVSNIKESLVNTISSVRRNPSPSTNEDPLKIYVVIRKYLVQSSNAAAAVLANIAWCAVSAQQDIIYHEEFYATAKGALIVTLGMVKNQLHKAIIRRIATNAVMLAAADFTQPFQPVAAENTFLDYAKAEANLPSELFSMAPPGYVWTNGYTSSGAILAGIRWDWASQAEHINWPEYILRK
jgi:hypothetical protein